MHWESHSLFWNPQLEERISTRLRAACLLAFRFFFFFFKLSSFIFYIWCIGKTFDICPNIKCTLDFITYILADSSYAQEHFL